MIIAFTILNLLAMLAIVGVLMWVAWRAKRQFAALPPAEIRVMWQGVVIWVWTILFVFFGLLPYVVGNKHWLLILLSNLLFAAVLQLTTILARNWSRRT